MLLRLAVLDEFSWQKAPDMCNVLSSLHSTLSTLLWYCLISSDEQAFNLQCDDDVYNLHDDLHLDDDSSSAAKLAHLSQSPFYRVARSMFFAAHHDEFQQHLRNHQHEGLVTPYRMTEFEFTDSELVVSLDVNHARINAITSPGRRASGHQTSAAYPSRFTRV